MKKFEYKVVRSGGHALKEDELNTYGDKGWELVTSMYITYNHEYVFKREVVI